MACFNCGCNSCGNFGSCCVQGPMGPMGPQGPSGSDAVLPTSVIASLGNSVAQTVAATGLVSFATTFASLNSTINPASTSITVTQSGYYRISYGVVQSSEVSATFAPYVNDSAIIGASIGINSSMVAADATIIRYLFAGDVVTLVNTSNNPVTLANGQLNAYLTLNNLIP